MTGTPTFSAAAGFLGITRNDCTADFVVAGVPLDIGTTNRAGARDEGNKRSLRPAACIAHRGNEAA
jgi:hypothetical protein